MNLFWCVGQADEWIRQFWVHSRYSFPWRFNPIDSHCLCLINRRRHWSKQASRHAGWYICRCMLWIVPSHTNQRHFLFCGRVFRNLYHMVWYGAQFLFCTSSTLHLHPSSIDLTINQCPVVGIGGGHSDNEHREANPRLSYSCDSEQRAANPSPDNVDNIPILDQQLRSRLRLLADYVQVSAYIDSVWGHQLMVPKGSNMGFRSWWAHSLWIR